MSTDDTTARSTGWVIIHPSGYIETDYFHNTQWRYKGKPVTRRTWMRHYRPTARMMQATIVRRDVR